MARIGFELARVKTAFFKGLSALGLLSLGACASFSGMAEPVVPASQATLIASQYLPPEASRRYRLSPMNQTHAEREGMTSRAWRDHIVTIYVDAAEARYTAFKTAIRIENRGANFALDLATIALSGAGSLVTGGETANTLAAITGGLTGARASLNKEVYFDMAFPALLAAMDAARDQALTQIYENMLKPETEYSLDMAFADLRALQRAASLDQAIQRVTVQAASDAAEQHRAFQNVQRVVRTIPVEERAEIRQIRDNINALVNAANDQAIGQIMAKLGLPRTGSLQEQSTAALLAIGNMAPAQRTVFLNDLKTQHSLDLARAPGG